MYNLRQILQVLVVPMGAGEVSGVETINFGFTGVTVSDGVVILTAKGFEGKVVDFRGKGSVFGVSTGLGGSTFFVGSTVLGASTGFGASVFFSATGVVTFTGAGVGVEGVGVVAGVGVGVGSLAGTGVGLGSDNVVNDKSVNTLWFGFCRL
jgi:hypothetical protein